MGGVASSRVDITALDGLPTAHIPALHRTDRATQPTRRFPPLSFHTCRWSQTLLAMLSEWSCEFM